MKEKINVVLCGLGFGSAFVPIYRDHPYVGSLGLFDPDPEQLERVSRHHQVPKVYGSFEQVLGDPAVDAVHLVSPIPAHEEQTVQVLESGKHCACTVPMATTLRGIRRIVEAQRKSGKNYMMMETTLYTRQFFYAKSLLESGGLGRIQFLRGSHYQDMENWPDYWLGLPPMWYGTHAIAPIAVLSGSRVSRVNGFGSGTMREELTKRYGNPYPVETAVLSFENGLKGEVTRSLFETARTYQEGMNVYGSRASLEWGFRDEDRPLLTRLVPCEEKRGYDTPVEEVEPPACYRSLPESIRRYTVNERDFDATNPQRALEEGAAGGHHGSHPHLVHEFLSSIWEGRKPWIDERLGGHITAIGVCAHLSALKQGEAVAVPRF